MLKNMRLVILFDMLRNPSFKMTTGFANVAITKINFRNFAKSFVKKILTLS